MGFFSSIARECVSEFSVARFEANNENTRDDGLSPALTKLGPSGPQEMVLADIIDPFGACEARQAASLSPDIN
jgi:hypothetical protein